MLLRSLFSGLADAVDDGKREHTSTGGDSLPSSTRARFEAVTTSACDAEESTRQACEAIAAADRTAREARAVLEAVESCHQSTVGIPVASRLVTELEGEASEGPSQGPMKGLRAPRQESRRRVREGKRRKAGRKEKVRGADLRKLRRQERRREARRQLARR